MVLPDNEIKSEFDLRTFVSHAELRYFEIRSKAFSK
jgi:hypothetical protein